MKIFLLVFCALIPFKVLAGPIGSLANKSTLSAEGAMKYMACSPVTISNSGPISNSSSKVSPNFTMQFGTYKFIRTDIGDPDGELKVYNGKKLICHIETSLLTGIKIVPKTGILLAEFSSGSARNWEIFMTGGNCVSAGYVPESEMEKFEAKIEDSSLKNCE